jgi:glyoxylase-like metal-dependent hydrolase (beta-lactamase superfamily II)
MKIKSKPMGAYQTNCYILEVDNKSLIIDPGVDSTSWVLENAKNPVAILNTHGHFDHVWCDKELKEKLNIPIYIHSKDAFMLTNDPFFKGTPKVKADFSIGEEQIDIEGIKVRFWHFPGHTPGNSVIEFENIWFSGDFLFKGSIGRWDFPYSSPEDMIRSLKKVEKINKNFTLLPGHGDKTTLKAEQKTLQWWIEYIKRDTFY